MVIDMNGKLLAVYKQFLDARTKISSNCQLAPYDWYSLPDKLSRLWIGYCKMLSEYSRELANSINELGRYIINLEAWKSVIKNIDDEDDKYEVIIEFVNPFATLAINLPYVIRSRYIYSVAHLCHQANMTKQKKWIDNLPIDEEIWFQDTDKYSNSWRGYKKLKPALEKISNKKYQSATYDFRNKYNHRYSPKIELGMTELVKRKVGNDGKVSYIIGQTNPLKLIQLLPILEEQHANCLKAFEKFQNLVNEHISVISQVY
jgi:hypothetical protein